MYVTRDTYIHLRRHRSYAMQNVDLSYLGHIKIRWYVRVLIFSVKSLCLWGIHQTNPNRCTRPSDCWTPYCLHYLFIYLTIRMCFRSLWLLGTGRYQLPVIFKWRLLTQPQICFDIIILSVTVCKWDVHTLIRKRISNLRSFQLQIAKNQQLWILCVLPEDTLVTALISCNPMFVSCVSSKYSYFAFSFLFLKPTFNSYNFVSGISRDLLPRVSRL